jgi:hypothetical protein
MPDKPDIIFICGAYKSGTSLITHLLEKKDFYNPASFNNTRERGKGLSQWYMTKECAVTRKINQTILSSSGIHNYTRVISLAELKFKFKEAHLLEIKGFLLGLPPHSVLKDPQFTYTLYYWLEACKLIRRRPMVYFTERPREELISAWNEAYFTRSLLNRNPYAMENVLYMQQYQKLICDSASVPTGEFRLQELKDLNSAL